jgi:GlcNAc-PI de-N-acetylase
MKSTILIPIVLLLSFASTVRPAERLENYTNKTVLIFTPHPDDDTFAVGGTMALLAHHRNRVVVVIYTTTNEANYCVNIDATIDLKTDAISKQVSQFEPAMTKYRPDWDPQNLARLKEDYRKEQEKKDGHYVESFRFATEFNQK